MMQDLTITLIQSNLYWEDPLANQNHFEILMEKIPATTDLIILPEMFSTGFSMRADGLAHDMAGRTVAWLRELCRRKGAALTGSLMIAVKGRFFNRLLWATPDNALLTYDKRHLFRYAGEEKVYTPGDMHLTVNLQGWRIRPFICYDLRFPIWTRNINCCYDVALFVANWPSARAAHWRLLLRARAVENQCYVAGVNRVGSDGNGRSYRGDSLVVDPEGRLLFDALDQETIATVVLSAEKLANYRNSFPAWKDADADMIHI